MEDSRRLILGFILIFLIMVIFQFYSISRRKEIQEPAQDITEQEEQKEEKPEVSTDTRRQISSQEKRLEEIFAVRDTTDEQKVHRKDIIVVETNLIKVYLSPVGGTIDSIYLKEYEVKFSPLSKANKLLSTEMLKGNTRFPTDMIPFNAQIEEIKGEKRLIFSYLIDTLEINKTYFFREDSYLVELE